MARTQVKPWPAAEDLPEEEPSRHHRLWFALGVGGFLAMGVFWALVFSNYFASPNPDLVHDAAWVRRAGEVCRAPAAAVRALPNADTAHSAADRAHLLDEGTAALTPMVERLAAVPVATAPDRAMVAAWLVDWRVYLQDRRNYAAALRADPRAKPLVSKVHGGWVTDAVDTLAYGNQIVDCATPTDF